MPVFFQLTARLFAVDAPLKIASNSRKYIYINAIIIYIYIYIYNVFSYDVFRETNAFTFRVSKEKKALNASNLTPFVGWCCNGFSKKNL